MALLVFALQLFLGAVVAGLANLVRAAFYTVKCAAFLIVAPLAPLLFLGYACYSAARGKSVQAFLDEFHEELESVTRRHAFSAFEDHVRAAVMALPNSGEIEADGPEEPLDEAKEAETAQDRPRRRRRRPRLV